MSKRVQKKKLDEEKKKIGEEKIIKMCAEKDAGKKVIQKVINIKGKGKKVDEKKSKKMRAAFLKSKIWSPNTTINVGFMNTFDSEDIPRTELEEMKRKVDRNGVALKLDPIQEEVSRSRQRLHQSSSSHLVNWHNMEITFQSHPEVSLGGNTFLNTPTILQFEDISQHDNDLSHVSQYCQ
jgi:hypothetical protein